MSISGSYMSNKTSQSMNNMSKPSFFDLKKQASFYLKEKIKSARLALTDVTPVQLMTEEATNADPWAPDTRTLGLISRAAFEVDEYWRIVDILHTKLSKFERKNWRTSYNALIVLEHLLTHGPKRIAEEFETDKPTINDMKNFQHVDEKGFNWGLAVRKKSERILKLLENGTLLSEEREHARKVTREIKGFGSFSGRSASPFKEASSDTFGRSHSQFNEHGNRDYFPETNSHDQPALIMFGDDVKVEKPSNMKKFLKVNMAPRNDFAHKGDSHVWSEDIEESNSLMYGRSFKDQKYCAISVEEEDHPFNDTEKHSRISLLTTAEKD